MVHMEDELYCYAHCFESYRWFTLLQETEISKNTMADAFGPPTDKGLVGLTFAEAFLPALKLPRMKRLGLGEWVMQDGRMVEILHMKKLEVRDCASRLDLPATGRCGTAPSLEQNDSQYHVYDAAPHRYRGGDFHRRWANLLPKACV